MVHDQILQSDNYGEKYFRDEMIKINIITHCYFLALYR